MRFFGDKNKRWATVFEAVGQRVDRSYRQLKSAIAGPKGLLVYQPTAPLPSHTLTDAGRVGKILTYLTEKGCISRRHLVPAPDIAVEQLSLAHTFEYLERLNYPEVLQRIFGEAKPAFEADRIITHQRHVVGGTIEASRLAVQQVLEGQPVWNLGGGFHHAHRDHGEGFCVFNDVAVAIARLRQTGFGGNILVVDLDIHQGNGTRRFFADDPSVFTLSIHAIDWDEQAAGDTDINVALGVGVEDSKYQRVLDRYLPEAFGRADPDLVFYLAGTNGAADDGLGNWKLSSEGLFRRDRTVFEHIEGTPSVWLLAGGYGPNAWRYSARTLSWMLGGPTDRIPAVSVGSTSWFHVKHPEAGSTTVTGGDDEAWNLKIEDVLVDLDGNSGPTRLLGFYSLHGIETAMERYGVLEHIRKLGISKVKFEVDLANPAAQVVRIFSDDTRRDLLIELVVCETAQYPPYRLISIENLLMQNPSRRPDSERPLLPGQEHPGLGCLTELVTMLKKACERLEYDGVVFVPPAYHLAVQVRKGLRFLAPGHEARFITLQSRLDGLPLTAATTMMEQKGLALKEGGEQLVWLPVPMVSAVSQRLSSWVDGPEYQAAVEQARAQLEVEHQPSVPR